MTVDYEQVVDSIVAASRSDDFRSAVDAMEDQPDREVANVWGSEGSRQLTVGVTTVEGAAAVSKALDEAGVDASVEVVSRSQAELDAIVEGVYDLPGVEDVNSAIHDYAHNRVVLTSRAPVTKDLRQRAFEYFGDAVVLASEPQESFTLSREEDTAPFYSGAWWGDVGGPRHCTVGWSWVRPTGGSRMLTAGHCLPQNSLIIAATNATSYYEYVMGALGSSTWETGTGTVGADGDLATINTQAAGRSGAERMWTKGPTSTTSTTVNSVDLWTTNGQAVCYSGMSRGVQCGTDVDSDGDGGYNVADKDASYSDDDTGEVITHVAYATKGWGKCPQPGDSGAPVYINTPGTGVAAHGILSGGGGGGGDQYVGKYEPSNCRMWFTEIGQAYEHWDGHVETING